MQKFGYGMYEMISNTYPVFLQKMVLISILFLIHDKYDTNDKNLSIDMMKKDIFFCIILFLLE